MGSRTTDATPTVIKKASAPKQGNLPSTASTTKELTLTEDLVGSWGAEEATAEDIIIPKVLLMHGQSEKVLSGEKTQGELVRSTDWKTLSPRGGTLKIIPFKMFKTWRVSEIVGGQAEWRREEPWTPANTALEWDFTENGKSMRRDQAYNFYAMLADTDESEMPFPVKLQFTRTSRKAGKVLADHFSKCRMFNKPPAMTTFEIGSEFVNGDKQKYFVFTAKAGAQTTMDGLMSAKQWFDLISTSANVKEHDVAEKTVVTETSAEF